MDLFLSLWYLKTSGLDTEKNKIGNVLSDSGRPNIESTEVCLCINPSGQGYFC